MLQATRSPTRPDSAAQRGGRWSVPRRREVRAGGAPSGGYVLTGCLAPGRWAGLAAAGWLARGS